LDVLLDIFVGDKGIRVTDTDFDGFIEDGIGAALHFFRPGGGEEQGLTVLTIHFRDNFLDIFFKTHIQHAAINA